ncbi:MAG: glutathione S-transferase [Mariprofundus sp.]|nr:glutathione S-transferase [Mariprofundus sp.]
MKYPILYSFRRCPYAMRARMALYHAGIQCELREIALKDKPAAMLEISPKATVPVLQLTDGSVIDESLEIMDWALSEDDAWRHAASDQGKDAMFDLIHDNDVDFKMHLDRYKYPQRFVDRGDSKDVHDEHHFHAACDFLAQLEDRLKRTAYLFGDRPCMADVAIFPFVRQFSAVDRLRFNRLSFIHVQDWLNHWLADQSFQHIMVKYKLWLSDDKMHYLY